MSSQEPFSELPIVADVGKENANRLHQGERKAAWAYLAVAAVLFVVTFTLAVWILFSAVWYMPSAEAVDKAILTAREVKTELAQVNKELAKSRAINEKMTEMLGGHAQVKLQSTTMKKELDMAVDDLAKAKTALAEMHAQVDELHLELKSIVAAEKKFVKEKFGEEVFLLSKGHWQLVEAFIGGKPAVDIPGFKYHNKFYFGNDGSLKNVGGTRTQTGSYKIDGAKSPKEMDATLDGESVRAIYKIDGTKLHFCQGSATERPKDFKTVPGSTHSLMVFQHVLP